MACYSQTGLLQSLDILYKIQYTRVEGDVYAIALHETSLLSVYLLVRGLYFYLHTRFSCHRLPKLYANLLPVAPLPAGYLPAGWAVGFLSTHRLGRHAGHTKTQPPGEPSGCVICVDLAPPST